MVKRYGRRTMLSIAATVLIWSTTFAALVAALGHFSPTHLLFLRWSLTSIVFLIVGAFAGVRVPRLRDLPLIALAGMLGFGVYQVLLVNGQMGVSASMAGFLINMSPVFTVAISVAIGRERASLFTWAGLAVCMAGLALMAQARGGFGSIGPSALLIIGAALCFSLYTLVTRPLLATYRPLEVSTYATVAGSLPFLAFAPGAFASLATASVADIATLLYLATVPGALAYVLWSQAVRGLSPALAARFLYLVPVIGIPVAWVWVGEAPHPLVVVGGLTTVAGVALSTLRPARLSLLRRANVSEVPLPAVEAA